MACSSRFGEQFLRHALHGGVFIASMRHVSIHPPSQRPRGFCLHVCFDRFRERLLRQQMKAFWSIPRAVYPPTQPAQSRFSPASRRLCTIGRTASFDGEFQNANDLPGEEFVVERLELFPSEFHGQVGVVKEALHLKEARMEGEGLIGAAKGARVRPIEKEAGVGHSNEALQCCTQLVKLHKLPYTTTSSLINPTILR